jgi:uncharacterized protein YciI
MYFLMRCLHHAKQDVVRDAHRSAHREWVRTGGDGLAVVLIGSALMDEAGMALGNFGILEAADLSQARAFAEGDPFNKAGIVASVELTALPDTFQANRIAEPMTARG